MFTTNSITGLLAGVVVGAIGMELLNKTNPELVKGVEDKFKDAVESIKSSFQGKEEVEEA
ncbi:MAG: hypothetical protein HQK84_08295 [Nitrospinae bacterium]|nr:hypothetical protein [Nitrospinota bacterium]